MMSAPEVWCHDCRTGPPFDVVEVEHVAWAERHSIEADHLVTITTVGEDGFEVLTVLYGATCEVDVFEGPELPVADLWALDVGQDGAA